MRDDVQRDMSDSAYDFLRCVWPKIASQLGGGRVMPVELASKSFAAELDVLAGIDAWHVIENEAGLRGIASRIQWGDRDWSTFTVREHRPNGAATELEKRQKAVIYRDRGLLYPYLTVHAYMTLPRRQGRLLSASIVKTDDLYGHIFNSCADIGPRPNRDGIWRKTNEEDGVTFLCISWVAMTKAGYRLKVISEAKADRWAS